MDCGAPTDNAARVSVKFEQYACTVQASWAAPFDSYQEWQSSQSTNRQHIIRIQNDYDAGFERARARAKDPLRPARSMRTSWPLELNLYARSAAISDTNHR